MPSNASEWFVRSENAPKRIRAHDLKMASVQNARSECARVTESDRACKMTVTCGDENASSRYVFEETFDRCFEVFVSDREEV